MVKKMENHDHKKEKEHAKKVVQHEEKMHISKKAHPKKAK